MESKELDLTLGSPSLINILIFETEDQEDIDRTLELIKRDHTPRSIEGDKKSVKIISEDTLCGVELTEEKNCSVFSISINHLHDDYVSKEWQKDLEYYWSQVQPILNVLPKNPILFLSVFVGSTNSQGEALNLVQQYSEYLGCRKASAGVIGNCLLATFRKTADETGVQFLRRELLLSPINLTFPQVKHVVFELLADIKYLAIGLGKLDRLYRLCQPYFPQIDPAEAEIQKEIEGILNRMRQTEPVELETLKLWLSNVMERFSTLSILSGLIKRDQITAKTYVEENKNLFSRWSEISLEGYPSNALMETIEYNSVSKPFEDFVGRTEALRIQLETVSDMIRTYLSIRQQEQSSEFLKQQVKMLHAIEKHERLLKGLTWVVALFTITLVILEIVRTLHILP